MHPPASECTSSKGFVVGLNGPLMNLCLYLAWMQTAHIESLCVHPPIRYFRVVGVIWASHRCHSLCSESVRDFWVNLVFAAVGALGAELSVFLFLRFTVVDDRCAVLGTITYMPLFDVPASVQEDGEVMDHFRFPDIVLCPPKSK